MSEINRRQFEEILEVKLSWYLSPSLEANESQVPWWERWISQYHFRSWYLKLDLAFQMYPESKHSHTSSATTLVPAIYGLCFCSRLTALPASPFFPLLSRTVRAKARLLKCGFLSHLEWKHNILMMSYYLSISSHLNVTVSRSYQVCFCLTVFVFAVIIAWNTSVPRNLILYQSEIFTQLSLFKWSLPCHPV